jgi:hypothetical protein
MIVFVYDKTFRDTTKGAPTRSLGPFSYDLSASWAQTVDLDELKRLVPQALSQTLQCGNIRVSQARYTSGTDTGTTSHLHTISRWCWTPSRQSQPQRRDPMYGCLRRSVRFTLSHCHPVRNVLEAEL